MSTTVVEAMGSETYAPDVEQRRNMFALMMLIKTFDERMVKGIRSGEFNAFYYSHRGQEAIPAALGAVLRPDDQLVTTYRGVHDHLGKGTSLVDVLGAILNRVIGGDQGKSSTMNLTSPESGAMFSTGIVGSGLPIAVGLGLAAQLSRLDRVVAVNFGDGASNTGSFHEAANLASVWEVPVVFVCQNNQWGEKTPTSETMRAERVADRAVGYGMPGVSVDGNDCDELFRAFSWAVEHARSGGGPSLVECLTYRMRGHSMGDDMSYVSQEQRDGGVAGDPVPRYRDRLLADGVCTADQLDAFETKASAEIAEALEIVLAAPVPDSVGHGLYADSTNIPF